MRELEKDAIRAPWETVDNDPMINIVGHILPAAHLERRFRAHYARKLLDLDQKAAYNHSAVDAMTRPLTVRENSAPTEIERTMTPDKIDKHRIFISSVQKELELERIMIASLITTDPFLGECLEPVLFDKEPVSGRKASKPYLKCLDTCDLYLLMINREYGRPHGPMSATHHEYRPSLWNNAAAVWAE